MVLPPEFHFHAHAIRLGRHDLISPKPKLIRARGPVVKRPKNLTNTTLTR